MKVTQFVSAVTKTIAYTYDLFDRRIKKVVDADGNPGTAPAASDTTHYVWDGANVLATLDGQQRIRQRYLHGPATDQMLGVVDVTYDSSGQPTTNVYWTLTDHQGSVRDAHCAQSTRTAYLYRLEDSSQDLLRWGVTFDMNARYPQAFLADKNMIQMDSGSRSIILRHERGLVETQPGPLNHEPWADTRKAP